jgi:hypothetical protein
VVGGVDPVNGGVEIWDKLVRRHANFGMVFCGHQLGAPRLLTSTGDAGNLVHQMLFNTQDGPSGGDGFMRLLEFAPDGTRCVVKTYSPHRDALGLDAWRADLANLFELVLTPPGTNPDADGDGMADVWEVSHGLDPGDAADGDDDPDGDGVSNRLEFAFARDPHIAETAPILTPSVIDLGDARHISLRFRRRIGIGVEIHASADLAHWEPESTVVEEIIDHGDGTETVRLRGTLPLERVGTENYRAVAGPGG